MKGFTEKMFVPQRPSNREGMTGLKGSADSFRRGSQSIPPVAKAEERMFPEHARAGVTHHDAHLFAAAFLIAVHRAFGAGWLFRAELAAIQSDARVVQEALAFRA